MTETNEIQKRQFITKYVLKLIKNEISMDNNDLYESISNLEILDFEYIKENINLPWNWYNISSRKDLDFEFVKENINLPWNWLHLSYNPNLDFEFVKNNLELPWYWNMISANKSLNFEFIKDNLHLPWNFYEIIRNKDIVLDLNYIKDELYKDFLPSNCNYWYFISENYNLDFNFVENNINLSWCWNTLSKHKNFNLELLRKYPNKNWDYAYLSSQPDLDLDFVTNNLHLKWDFISICRNNNFKKVILNYEAKNIILNEFHNLIPSIYIRQYIADFII